MSLWDIEKCVAAARAEAKERAAIVATLAPEDLCVRCGEAERVYDAAAYERCPAAWRWGHYPSDLDDHCEDCLEAGFEAIRDDLVGFNIPSDSW
jgi:hypothetical protein